MAAPVRMRAPVRRTRGLNPETESSRHAFSSLTPRRDQKQIVRQWEFPGGFSDNRRAGNREGREKMRLA